VRLSAELDTFEDQMVVATRDLSLGGMGVDLDRPLKEGSVVSLSLFLVVDEVEDERSAPITARAKVAWCAESDEEGRFSAGLRFDGLTTHQQEWLGRFLAAVAR
jgi:c-di-GMP-binding flagellar brake protein YcgR